MEILDFIVFLLYAKNENAHYIWSLTLVFMKGRAKSKVFGEVSINLADYADATKSSSVSLPLKNSNSDAVLHVSISNCYLIVCESVVFEWSLDLNIRNCIEY